jgi:diguanylate cyclase (GGDEF)-like protein/PAS domain S-box-containing protein
MTGDQTPTGLEGGSVGADASRHDPAETELLKERLRVLKELRASEERFRTLLSNIPAAMYRCGLDSNWDMEFISDNVEAISGYPASDFIQSRVRTFASIIHPEDQRMVEMTVGEAVGRGEPYIIEYRILAADGRVRWVYENGQGVFGPDGSVLWLDGAIFDVTERKLLQEQIAKQAFYDSLTGLANRALFHDRADHALARALRSGGKIALLLIDLDRFKVINDSLGHHAGDEVLVAVAKRLLTSSRASDTVARLGGDEFVVLLEESITVDDAITVTKRILAILREPLLCQGYEVTTGASIGIAFSSGSSPTSTDDLLRDADAAMYYAKGRGRGRYEVFEPSMHARVVQQLELTNELHRGLQRGEFVLHYLPIWELADRTLIGVEALVRWNHPSRGLLPPNDFIPAAEQTGSIVALGEWVFGEACRQVRAWNDAYPGRSLSLSVNISARQLLDPDLVQRLRTALTDNELEPSSLTIEIGEDALMQGVEETRLRLRDLKSLGVRLAIDDFGSSSLGYLRKLPIDELKIDRTFVRRMVDDPAEGTNLVRAILGLARALHLEVVAEGIELSEQLDGLRESGCETGQGFFFATPVVADEIEFLLGASNAAERVVPRPKVPSA